MKLKTSNKIIVEKVSKSYFYKSKPFKLFVCVVLEGNIQYPAVDTNIGGISAILQQRAI